TRYSMAKSCSVTGQLSNFDCAEFQNTLAIATRAPSWMTDSGIASAIDTAFLKRPVSGKADLPNTGMEGFIMALVLSLAWAHPGWTQVDRKRGRKCRR